ncbi:MAG: non-hydrolyzing UDP-N-acetylglucosamine 2-epimerase [Bacteroidota bacterium]
MKKIVTIIGARPQIIKSAAISRAVRSEFAEQLQEVIVHTGQHYDENMSSVFFDEMNIPEPDYNLEVGSASQGKQTAMMIERLEDILAAEKPDALLVYGDTNSTLAGAITASKMHIPIVHVEAGLRSFNKTMPEEVNRVVCDHLSTLLFSPTRAGYRHLQAEGFSAETTPPYSPDSPKIYHCGDIMLDNTLFFKDVAIEKNTVIKKHQLTDKKFFLSTVHRGANTDDASNLTAIFEAFLAILEKYASHHIVLPLHPRTLKSMEARLEKSFLETVRNHDRMIIIPPVSYLNILALESQCELLITDSGGLQKEAYFNGKPCVVLRPETEWTEIVEQGNAIIANADKQKIIDGVDQLLEDALEFPPLYGNGKAAVFVCEQIVEYL